MATGRAGGNEKCDSTLTVSTFHVKLISSNSNAVKARKDEESA